LVDDPRIIPSLQSIACSFVTNEAIIRRHKYTLWKVALVRLTLLAHEAFPGARDIQFIFNEKEQVDEYVEASYRAGRRDNRLMRAWTSPRLPRFKARVHTFPLQASGALAWGLRHDIHCHISRRPNRHAHWFTRLRDERPSHWRCYEADALDTLTDLIDMNWSFEEAFPSLLLSASDVVVRLHPCCISMWQECGQFQRVDRSHGKGRDGRHLRAETKTIGGAE